MGNRKEIFGILIVLLLLGAIFFGGYMFSDFFTERQKEGVEEGLKVAEKIHTKQYSDAFSRVVEGKYFLFPIEKTVSFGENKDLAREIGKYEEVAKEKEAILMMEFNDKDGQTREAYVKSLELNDENIAYVLKHYTDYFDSRSLSDTEQRFKFSIDDFKEEEYKKETKSGAILTSDDTIFVIMSNNKSVDPFLDIFKKNNDTNGTFLEYLEKNQDVLSRIDGKLTSNEEKMKQAMQKVPEDVKNFVSDFWKGYINLDTEELKDYYADQVWFYAGEEWFEEWGIDYEGEEAHEFMEVEKNKLLEAYQNIKAEDFEEDLSGMQKLTDDIRLYPAVDLMNICDAEDKEAFFNHFRIKEGDVIMIVRLDNSNTCTVKGEFFGGEMRFFVIRNIDGEYKVVTDFTE